MYFDKTGTLTKRRIQSIRVETSQLYRSGIVGACGIGGRVFSHPIANSIKEAYAQNIDMNRVSMRKKKPDTV